jgi:hypothetical protein
MKKSNIMKYTEFLGENGDCAACLKKFSKYICKKENIWKELSG